MLTPGEAQARFNLAHRKSCCSAHLDAFAPKQRIERLNQLPLDLWRWRLLYDKFG
jgi:hypothetical protein